MHRIILYCLLFLLTFQFKGIAQPARDEGDCISKLGKSFISDGQEYQLILKSNRYTKLNVVFLPHFKYRLVICMKNRAIPLRMRLTDSRGRVLYRDNDMQVWNFQFDALMNAVIELKLPDSDKNDDEEVSLLLGYKPIGKKQ